MKSLSNISMAQHHAFTFQHYAAETMEVYMLLSIYEIISLFNLK